MIQRPLWTLPISESLFNKLKDAGFDYVEDITCEGNKEEVAQILSDSGVDASILQNVFPTYTALELYRKEIKKDGNIVTFSKSFDDLFDGGIPTSQITELVGAPGTGKTQICLQLCVSVQIPEFLGGLEGSAVYIETNSNFSPIRIQELYAACSAHCAEIAKGIETSPQQRQSLMQMIKNNPFNNITKFTIEDTEQLKASMFSIRNLVENSSKNIKLIIIDSFTFPFYPVESSLQRTEIIYEILNHLLQLTSSHHLAVVVTNEMTTYIHDDGNSEVIPSLGESFAHLVHNRILVERSKRSNIYKAALCKSPAFPTKSVYFQITQDCVTDVSESQNTDD